MVIENQGSQVLQVDQSQISYSNPQYLVQNTTENSGQQQQVYYMEELNPERQVDSQLQQTSTPIVLNNHIQGTQIHGQLATDLPKVTLPSQSVVHQHSRQVQSQNPGRLLPQVCF